MSQPYDYKVYFDIYAVLTLKYRQNLTLISLQRQPWRHVTGNA